MSLWEDTVLSSGRSHFGLNSTLYLHKHSNIPVAASAVREPRLTAAAPWAVPGVGISEGQESQRVNPSASRLCPAVKGTFCQNKVWEAVLSFSWVGRGSIGKHGAPCPGWSRIHSNTHRWPHSRAVGSMRRFLLILMGFMLFAKLNAAWHEVPFFCPRFAPTGGAWCLLLAGIWRVGGKKKGKKGYFLCLLKTPGLSRVRNSPDFISMQNERLFSSVAGLPQDSSWVKSRQGL